MRNTGHLDFPGLARPRTTKTPEVEETGLAHVEGKPRASIRQISRKKRIPKSTFHEIL